MQECKHISTLMEANTKLCFHEGKDLFPEDILMKHWRLNNADSNVISSRTIKVNQIHNSEMTLHNLLLYRRS